MLCSALGVLRQQQIVLPCRGGCMSTSELLEVAEAMPALRDGLFSSISTPHLIVSSLISSWIV